MRIRRAIGTLPACSAGAAAIHAAVIGEHVRESWLFGVFFVFVSALQAGWAVAFIVRPSRRLLRAAILGNALLLAVWLVSRTLGVPLGPDPGIAEPIGLLDALA